MLLAWTNVEIKKDRVHLLFLRVMCDVFHDNYLAAMKPASETAWLMEAGSLLILPLTRLLLTRLILLNCRIEPVKHPHVKTRRLSPKLKELGAFEDIALSRTFQLSPVI